MDTFFNKKSKNQNEPKSIDEELKLNSEQMDQISQDVEKASKRDSDRLGTEPIHGLFIKMSMPLVLSMFVLALYNVVDSIFVSWINENALTAVTLCFPFQNLNLAFGIGTAVGMSALLSRYLGAQNYAKVDKVSHNGFVLVVFNYIIFFIIGCFARPLIEMQTDVPEIIEYGTTYLQITQWLSIAPMTQVMLERLLQGTGKTKYILYIQASGAIFNIIMDPILIFGLLGFPKLGVQGAALATVFGQMLACGLGLYLNVTKNKELKLSLHKVRPHLRTMRDIYKIGIPSIVLQSVGAVMNFTMNQILVKFSTTAVATFGAYFKLQSFVFMPTIGMSNGLVPIAAYNFGARAKKRLEKIMALGVRYGVGLMLLGTILFWVFPRQLIGLFNPSPEMEAMGVVALRTMSLVFPVAGFCIMRGSVFQALGKSIYSMNISLVRQLLVIIPAAYLIASTTGDVNMVWWAFPLAEIFGLSMSLLYTRRIKRTILNNL